MNTKHTWFFWGVTFLSFGMLFSCSKDNGNQIETEPDSVNATIAYYVKNDTQAQAGPLYMTEIDGAIMALYTSPKMPDCDVVFFQDSQTQERTIMMLSNENIFFIPMDAKGYKVQISAFGREEGFNTLLIGEYNTRTGKFTQTGSYPTGVETLQTKAEVDDFDWVRRSFKEGLVDPLFGNVSLLCAAIPKVGSILSHGYKTAHIMALHSLLDGAGTVLGDEIKQTAIKTAFPSALDAIQKVAGAEEENQRLATIVLILDLMPYSSKDLVSRQVFRYSEKEKGGAFPIDEEYISSGTSSLGSSILGQADYYYNSVTTPSFLPSAKTPFILSFSVSGIGEDTATFSGSCSATSEYGGAAEVLVEQGFKYIRERDGYETYVKSEGLGSKSVWLSPATSYMAMTYVKTLSGKEWYSNAVRFFTKGTTLEFSPLESFIFSYESGEQVTNVRVGDGATWEVKSAPAWCTVHYSNTDIRVSTQKGGSERSGEIVVETTSPYGEKESASLPVVQKSLSWDGSVWEMNYSQRIVKAVSDGILVWEDNVPKSVSSIFAVENAAAGQFLDTGLYLGKMTKVSDSVLSFHDSELEEHEVQVVKDKKLVTEKLIIKRELSVTMNRTDANHVKVNGTVTASASGAAKGSAMVSISGSGSLMINTKAGETTTGFTGYDLLQYPSFSLTQ